ncbi:glycoside hydrolase family protein [Flammeovirga kamogawensis]|uniref:Glycoside hydrolase family protein n=1 Tax=Flammeovirga kamogawensis TaxID=373891 RepID=A0ABX8H2W7_9BACT|nr:glycoside hydrolase family protein [Flammeovirga kamogawensis]MBB6460357.1 hypothetical protein [Flammeovirga kamogawensis]QWG10166.1 glycoside hydrolase family protein [Flammeovirga kamogawensis]TRX64618.1 hypothetical protein EO216_18940 [Flammeovirga kamogawensis]
MKNFLIVLLSLILFSCITTTKQTTATYTVAKDTDDLTFQDTFMGITDDNIFYDSLNFNWGASIIKGDDNKYHCFYAQMPRKYGFLCWLTDGVVAHAIADHPAGPYTYKEDVLTSRGFGNWDAYSVHNPRIKKYNGKYYLYYISTNTGDTELTPNQFNQARTKWIDNEYRALVRINQRIGVAVADNLNGPWQRLDQPIVTPAGPIANITCNPAITERPEGGYLMFVRGDKPNENTLVRSQAIALADHPEGPWVIQEQAAVGDLNAEDPCVWYDKNRQRYYAIYHAFGYLGMITSTDGLSWHKAKNYKVSDLNYKTKNGKTIKVHRMERPFVFLEDGNPSVFTVSIKTKEQDSYTLFIPLKEDSSEI